MTNISKFSLDKNLSKETKYFVLLAAIIVIAAFMTDGSNAGLFLGSLIGLTLVTFVDVSESISAKYPVVWRVIKYTIITLILLLSLLGFVQNI